jgi:hypothetical protein
MGDDDAGSLELFDQLLVREKASPLAPLRKIRAVPKLDEDGFTVELARGFIDRANQAIKREPFCPHAHENHGSTRFTRSP